MAGTMLWSPICPSFQCLGRHSQHGHNVTRNLPRSGHGLANCRRKLPHRLPFIGISGLVCGAWGWRGGHGGGTAMQILPRL
jgi:hypothetical protein